MKVLATHQTSICIDVREGDGTQFLKVKVQHTPKKMKTKQKQLWIQKRNTAARREGLGKGKKEVGEIKRYKLPAAK